jgi:hypothetical protein
MRRLLPLEQRRLTRGFPALLYQARLSLRLTDNLPPIMRRQMSKRSWGRKESIVWQYAGTQTCVPGDLPRRRLKLIDRTFARSRGTMFLAFGKPKGMVKFIATDHRKFAASGSQLYGA